MAMFSFIEFDNFNFDDVLNFSRYYFGKLLFEGFQVNDDVFLVRGGLFYIGKIAEPIFWSTDQFQYPIDVGGGHRVTALETDLMPGTEIMDNRDKHIHALDLNKHYKVQFSDGTAHIQFDKDVIPGQIMAVESVVGDPPRDLTNLENIIPRFDTDSYVFVFDPSTPRLVIGGVHDPRWDTATRTFAYSIYEGNDEAHSLSIHENDEAHDVLLTDGRNIKQSIIVPDDASGPTVLSIKPNQWVQLEDDGVYKVQSFVKHPESGGISVNLVGVEAIPDARAIVRAGQPRFHTGNIVCFLEENGLHIAKVTNVEWSSTASQFEYTVEVGSSVRTQLENQLIEKGPILDDGSPPQHVNLIIPGNKVEIAQAGANRFEIIESFKLESGLGSEISIMFTIRDGDDEFNSKQIERVLFDDATPPEDLHSTHEFHGKWVFFFREGTHENTLNIGRARADGVDSHGSNMYTLTDGLQMSESQLALGRKIFNNQGTLVKFLRVGHRVQMAAHGLYYVISAFTILTAAESRSINFVHGPGEVEPVLGIRRVVPRFNEKVVFTLDVADANILRIDTAALAEPSWDSHSGEYRYNVASSDATLMSENMLTEGKEIWDGEGKTVTSLQVSDRVRKGDSDFQILSFDHSQSGQKITCTTESVDLDATDISSLAPLFMDQWVFFVEEDDPDKMVIGKATSVTFQEESGLYTYQFDGRTDRQQPVLMCGREITDTPDSSIAKGDVVVLRNGVVDQVVLVISFGIGSNGEIVMNFMSRKQDEPQASLSVASHNELLPNGIISFVSRFNGRQVFGFVDTETMYSGVAQYADKGAFKIADTPRNLFWRQLVLGKVIKQDSSERNIIRTGDVVIITEITYQHSQHSVVSAFASAFGAAPKRVTTENVLTILSFRRERRMRSIDIVFKSIKDEGASSLDQNVLRIDGLKTQLHD